MPKTPFDPKQHGFRFANHFVNTIATLPRLGTLQTLGRCGGMAFCALDHYFAQLPLPTLSAQDLAPLHVPPDGHPLADYIYRRQLDSFATLSAVKFVTWTLAPDKPTFFARGVIERTRADEFHKLRERIDHNQPAPLGLIAARDLSALGKNHQVVAYGYEQPENDESALVVHIYDVNYPAQELTLTYQPEEGCWIESSRNRERWRGWFVQDYSPRLPPPDLHQLVTRAAPRSFTRPPERCASQATRTVRVTLRRVTFHHPQAPELSTSVALVMDVGNAHLRFPARGTREVKHGSRWTLNKTLEIELDKGAALTIQCRLDSADTPADLALDTLDAEACAGALRAQHPIRRSSFGMHRARSVGERGWYVLEYEIGA